MSQQDMEDLIELVKEYLDDPEKHREKFIKGVMGRKKIRLGKKEGTI